MERPIVISRSLLAVALLLPICCWTSAAVAGPLVNPWSEVKEPLPGPVQIIGGYTAGCIKGSVSLQADEGDFQLMRKSRRRYFADPRMRRFIQRLAGEVQEKAYGKLLVGDLSQARGGPTTTGHASHQVGLDGDFWFWLDSAAGERRLTRKEEEKLGALSMLNQKGTAADPKRFRNKHVKLLEFVTAQPEVERIFVNPLIKKALCERTDQAPWLAKIRPWWGHHYHFHVRLGCPEGQADCKLQDPPKKEHGCGADLAWWFSKEAAEQARKNREESRKLTPAQRLARKLERVPKKCQALLP